MEAALNKAIKTFEAIGVNASVIKMNGKDRDKLHQLLHKTGSKNLWLLYKGIPVKADPLIQEGMFYVQ